MRVITDSPIIEDHSNALGDKWRERRAKKGKTSSGIPKAKGTGILSKDKRSERKVERQSKREARDGFFSQSNIAERKQNRKNRRMARKGATPLRQLSGPGGTKVYQEPIPVVKVETDGTITKVQTPNMDNPVATKVQVAPGNVVEIPTPGPGPGVKVDKTDLDPNPAKTNVVTNPTTGTPEVVNDYTEDEVEIVTDEATGQTQVFKSTDLDGDKGMSKGVKIGLIVGGVVVVGVVSYLLYKKYSK